MSIFQDAPASAAAGTGSLLSKFGAATLLHRAGALLTVWRNRRLVVNMRDFDDAQLADIGLTRSDVESALRDPGVDPTLHLIRARKNPLRGIRHN